MIERLALQAIGRGRVVEAADDQVEPAGHQVGDQVLAEALGHHHLQFRTTLGQARHHARHHPHGRHRQDADIDHHAVVPRQPVERLVELLEFLQDVPGGVGQGLAELRLAHPLGVAFVQAEAEDLLDLVDAAREGGLGQAERRGRPQQAGVLADRFYYAEMTKLQPLVEVTVHPFRLYIRILMSTDKRLGVLAGRRACRGAGYCQDGIAKCGKAIGRPFDRQSRLSPELGRARRAGPGRQRTTMDGGRCATGGPSAKRNSGIDVRAG